jgi:primase-polymerase (primpol)-like protein
MTNNPATWGSYEEACQCARRHGFSGVGFVFTKETGFTGLDIDDAIGPDGEIADWAKPIVACAESYAEKSVSGTGIHTIIRGNVEKALANKKAGIEIYDTGRYFCFTGHHLKDSPVEILPAPETLRLARERVEEVKARETPEKATKREAPGARIRRRTA